MKINNVEFVFDPNRQTPDGKTMTAGQQLFEMAYGKVDLPKGEVGSNQKAVMPVGGTPSYQEYIPRTLTTDHNYVPTEVLTDQENYQFESINSSDTTFKAINQRGFGITGSDSEQPLLATDGLSICVSPIAYSPSTGIGALAHIDPPSKLEGFANEFLTGFPNDGSPIQFDFVGGSPESAKQQMGEGNASRKHLTDMLQQLYDRPDSDRFNVRSFDVMNRRHATEISLDTRTGHIYPHVLKAKYDHTLESNFREMPGGYSSKPSAEMAGDLDKQGVENVRLQFDGTSSLWLQHEQNAIARGYINDTVGLLEAQGVEVEMDEVRSAMSVELNDVMGLDAEAMRSMEQGLLDSHKTKLDSTDPSLKLPDSLAQHCCQSIANNPGNLQQAVKEGIASWKDHQAVRLADALTAQALEQGIEPPSKEALIAAVRHGLDDKAFVAMTGKLGAGTSAFSKDRQLSPGQFNHVMRTAQCLESVSQQRRMTTDDQQTLMKQMASSLHQKLSEHPNLPIKQTSSAIFDKLLEHGHLEKEQMKSGKRVLDAISNLDKHKPVQLGKAPSKDMETSVQGGINHEVNRQAIGQKQTNTQNKVGQRI